MDAETLIRDSLRLCGVRLPIDTQLSEGLTALNSLLSLWSSEKIMIYAVTKESFSLVAGTGIYTIGSGGTFDTVRPQKLEDAYIRDSSNIDHWVDVKMTEIEYNEIADKTETGRPEQLYYSPEYPLGKIYFDLIPETAETFILDSWKQLTEFAALATTITLPDEYKKALRFNLAVDLAPEYGIVLDKTIVQQAVLGKTMLENVNIKTPEPARFDSALLIGSWR